jgi:hypothetical protein
MKNHLNLKIKILEVPVKLLSKKKGKYLFTLEDLEEVYNRLKKLTAH